jgi:hypothetical protein
MRLTRSEEFLRGFGDRVRRGVHVAAADEYLLPFATHTKLVTATTWPAIYFTSNQRSGAFAAVDMTVLPVLRYM